MTSVLPELPVLATERLILRVPEPADAALVARFVTTNRRHLEPWEPRRSEAYYTVPYWEARLARVVERARERAGLELVLLPRQQPAGDMLGRCSFSNIVRGVFQAAMLGYALDERAVGKGLMEEALRAAIDYCFREWRLHRIMANYMPSNHRSGSLLERLGFEREGYARDYLCIAGAWEDHVLTSKVNPEWRPEGA